jgi:hypothetical protein
VLYGDAQERVQKEQRRHLYVGRAELTQFLEEQRDSAVRRGESDPAFGAEFKFTQHTNELLGRPIHKAPPFLAEGLKKSMEIRPGSPPIFFQYLASRFVCQLMKALEWGGGGVCRGGM